MHRAEAQERRGLPGHYGARRSKLCVVSADRLGIDHWFDNIVHFGRGRTEWEYGFQLDGQTDKL